MNILDFVGGAVLAIEGVNRDSIGRDIALVEKLSGKHDVFWPPRIEAARIKLLVGEEQNHLLKLACERVLALAAGTLTEDISSDELDAAIDAVRLQDGIDFFWEVRLAEARFAFTVMREEEALAEAARAEREAKLEDQRLVDAVAGEQERVSVFVAEKPEVIPANLASDIRALEAVQWFDPAVARIVAAAKRIVRERKEARERAEREAKLERDRTRCAPSLERIKKFVAGTLPQQVATSTVATDLEAVKRCYGGDFASQQLIADAEYQLRVRRAADEVALDSVRRQAQDRYVRNRKGRAAENRQRAERGGSQKKQKH
jgi:hypothetical protein